jgi:hypothetical protein
VAQNSDLCSSGRFGLIRRNRMRAAASGSSDVRQKIPVQYFANLHA